MEYNFERLNLWKESRFFVRDVYEISKRFPKEELFGLTSQVRRAAISVVANFVEGNNRVSKKDQAHFYSVSFASLMEVYAHLVLAMDLGFGVYEADINFIKIRIDKIAAMLSGLRKHCLVD